MCCSYGSGSYELSQDGTVLASGGSFNSSETTSFCVTSTSQAQMESMASVDESVTEDKVEMYPNPAANTLNIAAADFDAKQYAIKDISGRILMTGNIDGDNTIVDISSLASGIYIVVVSNGSEAISNKVMKQ